MKKFSKEEIEEFFIKTTSGFYVSKCAENGGEDPFYFYISNYHTLPKKGVLVY